MLIPARLQQRRGVVMHGIVMNTAYHRIAVLLCAWLGIMTYALSVIAVVIIAVHIPIYGKRGCIWIFPYRAGVAAATYRN